MYGGVGVLAGVALTIDEPVLCGRARYSLHLFDVELRNGDGNVRYGRIRDDELDGPRRDGNGVSIRNDDAKPIWVFWNGESLWGVS
jgi:hypothetical protein